MKNLFLAQKVKIGEKGEIEGPLVGINNIGDLINRILPILISFAGLILLFTLIWGGYDFINSQGEAQKVKSAQAKITAGIIGIVLLVISYLLSRLISKIFGLGEGIF